MTKFVTRKQLASHFGVCAKTVSKWTAEGRIPYMQPGKHTYLYVIEDVEKAVSSSAKASAKS